MQTSSRIELAKKDVIEEFKKIQKSNGFRNDVASVLPLIRSEDQITQYPEIGIELGPEKLQPLNDKWTVYDSNVTVFIVGTVESNTDTETDVPYAIDAMEALVHDMRKVVVTIFSKYINQLENRWNVSPKTKEIIFYRQSNLGNKRNKHLVETSFNIKVRIDTIVEKE